MAKRLNTITALYEEGVIDYATAHNNVVDTLYSAVENRIVTLDVARTMYNAMVSNFTEIDSQR